MGTHPVVTTSWTIRGSRTVPLITSRSVIGTTGACSGTNRDRCSSAGTKLSSPSARRNAPGGSIKYVRIAITSSDISPTWISQNRRAVNFLTCLQFSPPEYFDVWNTHLTFSNSIEFEIFYRILFKFSDGFFSGLRTYPHLLPWYQSRIPRIA